MVTDRTPTVHTHDHTVPHALCPVCPQAYPDAFRHPQDVIDMVLRQVETVDTAKNALAMALHWLEDLVIYLVRVYMDHARTLQAAAIHVAMPPTALQTVVTILMDTSGSGRVISMQESKYIS